MTWQEEIASVKDMDSTESMSLNRDSCSERKRKLRGKFPVRLLVLLLLCTGCACHHKDFQKSSKLKAAVSGRTTPVVYVAIGDSTGLGLGAGNGRGYVDLLLARMQQTHPGSRLINLSTGWATTADVLSKNLSQFPTEATLVTVCVGLNDLMQGQSDEQFAENYEKIISTLERSGANIIITNLPNFSSAPAASAYRRDDIKRVLGLYNKRIDEIAASHNVPLVDLYKISSAAVQSRPDFFSFDGLHPSDAGYRFWAEAMWPMVEKTINE